MYKPPSCAQLRKHLSFKFYNISIGLDESCPFQYTQQNVLFLKPMKNKQYPKIGLDVPHSSHQKKFAKFSKAFHVQSPMLYLTHLSIHTMHLSIFPIHECHTNNNPLFQGLKGGPHKL
jgi:hypothetical protein